MAEHDQQSRGASAAEHAGRGHKRRGAISPWWSGVGVPLVFMGVLLLMVGGFFVQRRQRLADFRASADCSTASVGAKGSTGEFCRRVPLRIDRRWSSASRSGTKYGFDLSETSGVKYPGVETERAAHDAGRESDTVEGLVWRGEVVSLTIVGAPHVTADHPAHVPPVVWILLYALGAGMIIIPLRALLPRRGSRR